MAKAGGITNAVNVGIAVQADWENREFISHISLNVRRLFEFLVQFESTTKSKLASLNEKLDLLERRLEMLEVQVSWSQLNTDLFLQEAVARYKGFLYLIKTTRTQFCVPTYDVDLIWHTHQLHPISYCDDMQNLIGMVLQHDDLGFDRGKSELIGKVLDLDTSFSKTTAQWEETFGTRCWKAGAMLICKTPTPVTTSPYVSDVFAKEPNAKENFQNIIQFPELEVVEVQTYFQTSFERA